MKRLLGILLVVTLAHATQAQTIVAAEYFIDMDPGYGERTQIGFTASSDVTLAFTADLSGVSTGNHVLYIRVKDSNGLWSLSMTRPFVVDAVSTPANIVEAEYYYDIDPGYGEGNSITITPATEITPSFLADISGLSIGLHVLFVRTRDAGGRWSLTMTRPFVKDSTGSVGNITAVEYFIDADPGYGSGTQLSFTQTPDISASAVIDLAAVTPGPHVLFFRARDADGPWSLSQARLFVRDEILPSPDITAVEYFIDSDPGFGNGLPVSFIEDQSVTASALVDLGSASTGLHVLYLRARDAGGLWSLSLARPFVKETVSEPPDLAAAEYFVDTDPGFGLGTTVPLDQSSQDTASFLIDLSSTQAGPHVLFIRAANTAGQWSLSQTRLFYRDAVSVPPNIAGIEYHFTKDTTTTQGSTFSVVPASVVDAGFIVDVSPLEADSSYNLVLAAIDEAGGRSLNYNHSFLRSRAAAVAFNVSVLDLGRRLVGATFDSTYNIVNIGDSTMTIDSVRSVNAEFAMRAPSMLLSAGGIYEDTVGFTPAVIGSRTGAVVVYSDSPLSPDTLLVKGFGHGTAALSIMPDTVDFGFIGIGGTPDTAIVMTNLGNDTLFASVTSSNSVFTVMTPTVLVPPNETARDTVTFTVTSGGRDSAYIVVTGNHPTSPDTILVRGEGNIAVGVELASGVPETFDLQQNYPNPFNPSTLIRYQLPKRVHVSLRVYNLVGRVVESLVQQEQDTGYYEVRWSPRVASGVYFLRIETGDFAKTMKVLLLK